MTPAEILESLTECGVELWFEGARLRYRAPQGALTPELRDRLVSNKPALLALLRSQAAQRVELQPLSYGQEALWFLYQSDSTNPAYNVSFSARVCSSLDVPSLRRAVQAVIDRHPALRTSFVAPEGRPMRQIHAYAEAWLEVVDAGADSNEELRNRVVMAAQVPFDLENGPIQRVKVFTRGPQDHVLLITAHHIAVDGWSHFLILEELEKLYDAETNSKPVSLPLPKASYTDFVQWQQRMLSLPEQDTLWSYWRNQLDGDLPHLDLPLDWPRPKVLRLRGASQQVVLSPEITAQLRELARSNGATIFTVLLTAYYVLLHRYTSQSDILVGSPIYGRSRPEFADVVGDFINTIVLRGDLDGDPSYSTLLSRVRRCVLDALKHQDFPFSLLVERLQPHRDTSRAPIYQTTFQLTQFQQGKRLQSFLGSHDPETRLSFGGLELAPFPVPQQEGQFDLSLELLESDTLLAGALKYNTELFSAETAARMAKHFQTLLEAIVTEPDRPISQLALMRPEERNALLLSLHGGVEQLQAECLTEMFSAQVARKPEAVAVFFEGRSLTYRELDERSNQLARRLQSLGVGPDVLVGVAMERTPELVVGLLGVLRAGGAYMPLDPTFPEERLAFMLADSKVPVLITQMSLLEELPEHRARVVCLDRDWESISAEESSAPVSEADPENLAYVIYTSGSTGQPKGVQIPHRAVVNFLTSMQREPGLSDEDVLLSVTTLSFDISVLEIFLPLCAGAQLALLSREEASDGEVLQQRMVETGTTVMQATPTTWRLLIESGWDGDGRLKALCGGEAWSRELADGLRERCASVWNMYGPTETTIWSAVSEVGSGEGPVVIGGPIANTQLYLLDEAMQPVPIGVPGELYIGGEGLARGYLNRPELTAERFVADPFSGRDGARLYRTGDLVRYRPDVSIEFLGRLDHQVKVRGFRIELGEIESVLGSQDAVNSAVVVAHEMGAGDTRLVAYFVPEADGMDASVLRDHLRDRLPDYMIPQHLVELDALPLLPNGKVNRKGLPQPGIELMSQEYVAPHSGTEQALASIWQVVLKTERVGIHDGFFDIGGHSLLAAAVVARIRDELGIELSLRQLFEAQTVEQLALLIDGEDAPASSQMPALAPSSDGGRAPQSYAQQRLWYLDQLEPNTAVYNMPTALRLRGELDVDSLRQALNEIVRRHEALRTTLVAGEREDDLPVQLVAERLELEVLLEELVLTDGEDAISTALRVLLAVGAEPFDLTAGPLIRVRLLRLAEQDHVLQVVMHHAISDGWSLELFLKELRELYAAFRRDEPSPLAPLPVQYGDYARWQRDWLEGGELERQLEYWRGKFPVEPPALDLPTDRARPAIQGYHGAAVRFELSAALVAKLERLGQAQGATLFMVLLTAYKVLLSRYTGQESVSVGTPVANRVQAQLEPLIGFFVNTLVMNTDLSGQPSFEAALQRVQETCLDAYSHQDIPFERLVEAVNPARDLSRTPMFQTLFSYQDMSAVSLEMDAVKLEPFDLPVTVSHTDITLWFMRGLRAGLQGILEYSTDLFDGGTIEGFIERFQVLLEGIVASPQIAIGELPLLLAGEREQLVNELNDTAADYPRASRLHDLIAARVERTPDAIALEFEDERLSYAQLDERSTAVAGRLRGLGIEPASLVAVCLERSAELVVAMLGVLKAGCAYLPLDPGFPAQRLDFILEDASVACLVTESSLRERLPRTDVPLLVLDEAGEMADGLLVPGSAEDLAYVIYTSGSTGQPKGVQVTHATVVNLLTSMAREPGFSADDAMLAVTTPAFDISVLEMFLPLIVGGRLVVAGSEDVTSAERLQALLEEKAISVMQATPSTWRLLIESGWTGAARLKALCGGEALPQELASRIVERVGSLWNLYGPTETTIWSSAYLFESPTDPVYIGRPIANTRLYVLDRNGELCPIGVPGELYIGGEGVTRGYLNRPELTAERFLADPFSPEEGTRMYRTGDLVRYRDNAMLEYLGRLDHQVKVRGYRIELGEIETILGEHEAVNSAVAIAQEIVAGDTRLVAYWTGDKKSVVTGTGLRAFLRERLPGYMIPQHFIELDVFPLTPNGKVDRGALPGVFRSQTTESHAEPRTPVEQRIASIWQAVLGTDRVGIHDNFFNIGGHSLLAVQVVQRIKQELGVQVLLRNLVSDTLGQLALSLEDNVGEKTGPGQDRDRKKTTKSRISGKFKFLNFRS